MYISVKGGQALYKNQIEKNVCCRHGNTHVYQAMCATSKFGEA